MKHLKLFENIKSVSSIKDISNKYHEILKYIRPAVIDRYNEIVNDPKLDMKYLESYKGNQGKKINLNNKLVNFKNKFPTGKYMIFTCEDFDWEIRETGDVLYLGKIGNIEHVKETDENNKYGINYNEYTRTYLSVLLIDLLMEIDLPYEQFSTKEFNLDNEKNFKQILFTSNSREEAQKKFDDIKVQEPYSNWEENLRVRKNMRKFNI